MQNQQTVVSVANVVNAAVVSGAAVRVQLLLNQGVAVAGQALVVSVPVMEIQFYVFNRPNVG